MAPISDAFWSRADWWLVLALPVFAAALGALGNWLSLRLLFGPMPGIGAGSHVLDRRAAVVSERLALVLAPHFPLSETFRLMEPEKVASHVASTVLGRLDEHVDDIMTQKHSVLWANLPQLARQRVYARVQRQLPSILDNLIEDLAENIDELVDLRQLLISIVEEQRGALAAVLERALQDECGFLVRAGLVTGALLGLVEAVLWRYWPSHGLLLVGGALVAALSLLLPRAWLFRPSFAPGTNILLGGQPNFADVLGRWFASEVFKPRRLMQLMLYGPRAARTRALIRRHMRPLLDAGLVRTTIQVVLGVEGYALIKQLVVTKVSELTAAALSDSHFSQQRTRELEVACDKQLGALPPAELRFLVQSVLDEGLWQRVGVVTVAGLLVGGLEVALLWLLR